MVIVVSLSPLSAQYKITGQVTDSRGRYQKMILEYVPTIHDLGSADMNNIVNTAFMDSLGNFEFTGIGLPEEKALYRISANKAEVGIGISNGLNKNHIIISLDNKSIIHISDCFDISSDFSGCTVTGNAESTIIQQIYDSILSPVLKDLHQPNNYNSETKNQFITNKFLTDIKQCADTTSYILAGLVGIGMIDNLKKDYKLDPEYYDQLIAKWELSLIHI